LLAAAGYVSLRVSEHSARFGGIVHGSAPPAPQAIYPAKAAVLGDPDPAMICAHQVRKLRVRISAPVDWKGSANGRRKARLSRIQGWG
jgi:hypothetical protein